MNTSRSGQLNSADRGQRAVPAPPAGMPRWKRALDLVLILLALPWLLPLMLLVAAVIKIVSPGPALFQQERIGHRGRRFTCFKFRTMIVNADTSVHEGHFTRLIESDVPMMKLDATGDPRVIPCGKLLRSFGLDELPQILNVLRGEMSLVGPRPCLPYEYENYSPPHRHRFDAVPGLTGLWQVSGKNRTSFKEMIDLDISYAARQSLWLDLKIIFKTIPAIVAQARESRDENPPEPTPERPPVFRDASLEQSSPTRAGTVAATFKQ